MDILFGYKRIYWDIIGELAWILIRIYFMDIFKDKYGYNRIIWDVFEGYLFWNTF